MQNRLTVKTLSDSNTNLMLLLRFSLVSPHFFDYNNTRSKKLQNGCLHPFLQHPASCIINILLRHSTAGVITTTKGVSP